MNFLGWLLCLLFAGVHGRVNNVTRASILDFHNTKRSFHGSGYPLVWKDALENKAIKQATMLCSNDTPISAKLAAYACSNSPIDCLESVYQNGESCWNYTSGKPQSTAACASYNMKAAAYGFQRVVWRASQNVGCAFVGPCGQSTNMFFLCTYSPPRNATRYTARAALKNVVPAQAVAAPPPVSTEADVLRELALAKHNAYRSAHGTAPLTWNSTLAAFAQQWADRCIFEHSTSPYGENLAWGHATIGDAIRDWYDEVRWYDYKYPVFSMSTGHFTQVVWANTRSLGCAVKRCGSRMWVCNYWPPGNYAGQFASNVRPLTTSQTKTTPASLILLAVIIPSAVIVTLIVSVFATRLYMKRSLNSNAHTPHTS